MDEAAAKKAVEIFTPQEMAEINKMEDYRSKPGLKEDHQEHLRLWEIFIAKVHENQIQNPASEIGRILALEWIAIFNRFYGPFPLVCKILKEKAEIIEASGSLDLMWGPGAWPWLKQAFVQHGISLPE